MRKMTYFTVAGALAAGALAVSAGAARDRDHGDKRGQSGDPSPLKDKLEQCKDGPFRRSDFSIGHRGASLQFPEHTKQSYEAGARRARRSSANKPCIWTTSSPPRIRR